jgi:hypothetical protein
VYVESEKRVKVRRERRERGGGGNYELYFTRRNPPLREKIQKKSKNILAFLIIYLSV